MSGTNTCPMITPSWASLISIHAPRDIIISSSKAHRNGQRNKAKVGTYQEQNLPESLKTRRQGDLPERDVPC